MKCDIVMGFVCAQDTVLVRADDLGMQRSFVAEGNEGRACAPNFAAVDQLVVKASSHFSFALACSLTCFHLPLKSCQLFLAR